MEAFKKSLYENNESNERIYVAHANDLFVLVLKAVTKWMVRIGEKREMQSIKAVF